MKGLYVYVWHICCPSLLRYCWLQGILPAGLAKVPTGELAEFISVCIEPRPRRPRARHLLKHPYFHTIRAEKAAVKLGAEALAHSISCAADLHQMVADCTASVAGSVSRTSSELAEVSAVWQPPSPFHTFVLAALLLGCHQSVAPESLRMMLPQLRGVISWCLYR